MVNKNNKENIHKAITDLLFILKITIGFKFGNFFGWQFCPFSFFQKSSKVVSDTNPNKLYMQPKIWILSFTQVNQWFYWIHYTKNEVFVTFTEKIFNGKLHFLRSDCFSKYRKLCQTSMTAPFTETVYGFHLDNFL